MSHKPVLELFDEYANEIVRRQDECWQTPSPEAFHQLRVHVKRIRALLSLVERLSNSKAISKRDRIFRAIFKAAGDVRDLHVQSELIKTVANAGHHKVAWYLELFEERERDAVQQFLGKHHKMVSRKEVTGIRKVVDKALTRRPDVELAARAWQHFGRCLSATIDFDVEKDDLHDLRITAKETSNLTWMLVRAFPQVVLDSDLKMLLDDLQNQLGNWHDLDIAVIWTDEILTESVPTQDRADWVKFKNDLKRRRGILRAKVLRRWKKLAGWRQGQR